MVTSFFRDSLKFEIHEKSENGRRLSPAAARGIAKEGAPGQREHDGLLEQTERVVPSQAQEAKAPPGCGGF